MRAPVLSSLLLAAACTLCAPGCGSTPAAPASAVPPAAANAGSPAGAPLTQYAADPDAARYQALDAAQRANVDELGRWGRATSAPVGAPDVWGTYAAGAAARLPARATTVSR
jgi:hypothetical protein